MNKSYDAEKKFKQFIEFGEPPLDYGRQMLKGEINQRRVLSILQGEIVPPYEVEIQTSSICNLACKHCFGRYYERLPNKIRNKELEIIANQIDEFQDNGFKIETVKFCGTTGEPLVNPATLYGIELFKNRGKKVMIFTNGLALDTPIRKNGLRYYDIVGDTDKINLSLDAGSEDIFFKLKGKHGFNRIIKSLENIVDIREKRNKSMDVRVSYVIGEENYTDIVNSTKIVKDAGANEIVFRIDFTGKKKAVELFDLISNEVKKAKEYRSDLFKVITSYNDEEVISKCYDSNLPGEKCFNHNFWACIGPDAELYTCGHRTYKGVKSYGNLLENSFRNIWISEDRKKAINSLPDEHCKNCSPSSRCRNKIMNFLSHLSEDNRKNLILNSDKLK